VPEADGYVTTEDGARLYYRRVGSGPNWVIVPNGLYLLDDFRALAVGRTFIFYDVRNRGRSEKGDSAKLERGIHQDVDDLEAVRRHFGMSPIGLIGHSYVGVSAALYAMRYTAQVTRVVQLGPSPPSAAKEYPAHLKNADATLSEVLSKLAGLQKERASTPLVEFCRKVWSLLRVIYVADPANAFRIKWDRCELPNEANFMKYWVEIIFPSLQALDLGAEDYARVKVPVLVVHGRLDRSAPYGGGRDWAALLPDGRLLTVPTGAHAPWIEDPGTLASIDAFLDGEWPAGAERVGAADSDRVGQ
jgi:pimeloyl-ACP methyl ester carboxylesterase